MDSQNRSSIPGNKVRIDALLLRPEFFEFPLFKLMSTPREKHPFYVKSNWKPPVQPSVALETYLEETKLKLAEIHLTQPTQNLQCDERKALRELRESKEINIKKADKGTTAVIMKKTDKITEECHGTLPTPRGTHGRANVL